MCRSRSSATRSGPGNRGGSGIKQRHTSAGNLKLTLTSLDETLRMNICLRTGRLFIAVAVTIAVGGAPVPGSAQQPTGDPPARVGRLGAITGTVSYHLEGADQWEPAEANLPVTSGSAFWTEPNARAEIGIARDRIVLDRSTEFDIGQLDDHSLTAIEPQGAIYLHLRNPATRDTYTVQTPRGTVSLAPTGRYEVVAGDTVNPTTVTVIEGQARLNGTNLALRVGPNQTATIAGDGTAEPYRGSVGPAIRDQFLTAMLASESAPPRRTGATAPDIVTAMTGADELDRYGEWSQAAEYGPVWYPPADPGFVPYRQGRWNFVQPWGWTWVDDAPWGFAPSHYGRWVEIDHRWGWTPQRQGWRAGGVSNYPVYAPAVVAFVGGFAAGALAADAIGWVPLGPREAYYPPYRVSNAYVRNVNVTNVTNVTTVVNTYNATRAQAATAGPPGRAGPANGVPGRRDVPRPSLMNAAAATAVPEAAMIASRPVAALARPVPAVALQTASPIIGRPPVAPTLATAGVTPGVARRLNLPAVTGPEPSRPAAPGPGLEARPAGQHGVSLREPAGGASRPAAPPGSAEQGPNRAGGAAIGGAAAGAAAGALVRPGSTGGPGAPGPVPTEPNAAIPRGAIQGAPGGLAPPGGPARNEPALRPGNAPEPGNKPEGPSLRPQATPAPGPAIAPKPGSVTPAGPIPLVAPPVGTPPRPGVPASGTARPEGPGTGPTRGPDATVPATLAPSHPQPPPARTEHCRIRNPRQQQRRRPHVRSRHRPRHRHRRIRNRRRAVAQAPPRPQPAAAQAPPRPPPPPAAAQAPPHPQPPPVAAQAPPRPQPPPPMAQARPQAPPAARPQPPGKPREPPN